MLKITKNKGVILISVFMVAGIIMTLSFAYVTSAILQGRAAQQAVQGAQAFYASEQGIESVYIETSKNSWSYFTHTASTGNQLVKATTNPTAPTLKGWSINSVTGCYEQALANGLIEVKTYADPDPLRADETLVLVRATVGSASRLLRFRISRHSLYKYLLFWPANWDVDMSGTVYGKQIDGGNVGAIHVNGNVKLSSTGGSVNFKNFAEFSCSGDIYYPFYNYYTAPYTLDLNDGAVLNTHANLTGYSTATAGYYYYYPFGGADPLFGSSGLGRSYLGDHSYHFLGWDYATDDYMSPPGTRANTINGLTRINDIYIPKQLPDSYGPPVYSVRKYNPLKTSSPGEQPITFNVPNDALKWLVRNEDAKARYAIPLGQWLASGDTITVDNQWQLGEYDKVTLLSLEPEALLANSDSTEYSTYKIVSSGTAVAIGADAISDQDGFFNWWKARDHHHWEDLALDAGVYYFASDTATVPAWQRIFFEAWLRYWPPAHGKTHNQINPLVPSVYPSSYLYYFSINPEWWQDLEYGNDRLGALEPTLDVKYLNTTYQGAQLYNWLQAKGLDSVVKYVNYGGKYETPLDVTASYATLAQAGGLYIREITAGNFTVFFNGNGASGALSACLSALGLNTWITTAQFYDPSGTNRAYTCTAANCPNPPPPIQAIQLDMQALIASGNNINNHLIYIESATYDTRVVNAATLPSGGFTLVTPYTVFLKAQNTTIAGTMVNAFNYEVKEKTKSSDSLDTNFQPAAIITNSGSFGVVALSSTFVDFDPVFNPGIEYPYGYQFPYSTPLSCTKFLQDYCYDNWPLPGATVPLFPDKPANRTDLTPAWVTSSTLTAGQQIILGSYGNNQWYTVNSSKMINQVTSNNIFNIAVASPGNPFPTIRERWQSGRSLSLQGAFIRLAGTWSGLARGYTICANYEKSRFSLPGTPSNTYKIISPSTYYSYQERFWYQQERPSADFFAGSQAVWQEFPATDYNFTHHVP